MLRSLKELEHYAVCSVDGKAGKCADFLLGSSRWLVRYIVVETGERPNPRQVVLPSESVAEIDRMERRFQLTLTKDQVNRSPENDAQKAATLPQEVLCSGLGGLQDASPGSEEVARNSGDSSERLAGTVEVGGDGELRSAKALQGFAVRANDGWIGQVDDLIVQDDIWEVRYLVLDTSNWWTGRKVLVAPQWARRISWKERALDVDMSVQAVRTCPEWDPSVSLDRDYETRLFRHYGFPSYWGDRESKSSQTSASDEAILIERQRHQHE